LPKKNRGGAPSGDMAAFDKALKAAIKNVKHRVPHLAVVLAESKSFTYFCM